MSDFPTLVDGDEDLQLPDVLPVLALDETVIFPFAIVPLSVEPDGGISAVDQALAEQRLILLAARRRAGAEVTSLDDLHGIGTVGLIMRMLKLP
ncbi:MAG: LON peptidase substrate-binding domain-containing protein, partial [Acidobacteriota bacterium]